MNNELRDPLEKVSNSLRRAVSVNKSRESDLRSKVNTIQRERRQSMNSWSLKQEKFLRAKLKMMPAIGMGNASERREREQAKTTKIRKITMTRGVMPVTMEETATNTTDDEKAPVPHKELQSSSRNPLPPIISPPARKKSLETRPYGFYLPPTRTIEEVSKTDQNFLDNLQKTRRASEYKSPVHTYLYGNREEQQEAIRHKLSVNELQNAAHLARKVSCYGARPEQGKIMEDIAEEGKGAEKGFQERTNNEETSNPETKQRKHSSLPSISTVLTTENEQGNTKALQHWQKIRQSLSTIVGREKKRDITKMSMLELTSLFEGIRDCRYLRVGAHTSYRGDSVDSKHCRCIACTVVDKTKLRNNLGAPE